ncbi:Flp family type IVb pilin [Novosphingobium sp. YJ-S2-02]|uniref:Flp family type IVb pilin n=1 Tax=Novosphingobium aureum TaxID=2792964 RepID=A0A931HE78_9SPHN|nr:Flp family type IVb pilin [Novosphingobium aureum]MBH0113751.1 Flp family type IVb pilin [Novosphingobium aureum]
MKLVREFLHDRDGATAVEYGVILAMIVIVIVVSIQGMADEAISMWDHVSEESSEAMGSN